MSLSFLQHAPVAACRLEQDRITHVNRAFIDLTGLNEPATDGRPLTDVLLPVGEDPDDYSLFSSSSVSHATLTRRVGHGPKAGQRVRVMLWRDGGQTYALVEAIGTHEQAAAALTESAALIAHEIRNPLAGIGSALEVIADRLPAGGAEREIIAEIRGRLDRLNAQVDDLLLLVRPVYVKRSATDLGRLVESACREAEEPFVPGPSCVVFADPNLAIKGLTGLIRYARGGDQDLRISWAADEQRGWVQLSGGRLAAIKDEAAEGWSVYRRQDGLELPVAVRIAEAQQGRLEAQITPEGVLLRFELPRGPEP